MVRTPLQMWERSGILAGKMRFSDFRVVTQLTLDRAVSAIRTHYANQIRTIEAIGGRIPHTVIIVWTGHELKVRIAGTDDLGNVRPNLHGPLYGAHSPFADTFNYNACRKAAKQLG